MTDERAKQIIEGQKSIIEGQEKIIRRVDKLLSLFTHEPLNFVANPLLNIYEASHLLNIPQTTLTEACMNNEIPCRKIGKSYFFLRDALITWMNLDESRGEIKESIDTEVAAELLGVPINKVRQWARGYAYYKMPVIMKGARCYFDKDELLKWMDTPGYKKLKDEYIKNRDLNEQRQKAAQARYEIERLEKEAQDKERLEKKLLRFKIEKKQKLN